MASNRSKKVGNVPSSITFDSGQYSRIQQVAHEKRVSVAWVVRDAILKYLRDESAPRNTRFRGTE